ncbi:DUF3772 domain-containing protein [Pseudoruegeria sp. SK021]|uniref:DUF3772 domain-containing protein n=1 Tax=Pseudoruegeria sp. SK021 TaxID=1933035 RepID=UPI000A24DC71|nr:DUF3772 domain-containing protein [Pseudoruegeria sp. SK021]OSP55574.1 hypothetical protein BV911_06830 [Pseudoruegeria sp. SK021]
MSQSQTVRSFWAPVVLALTLCFSLLLGAGAGLAQDQTASPDYDNWLTFVDRVEEVFERDEAKEVTLQRLRSELIGYRDKFNSAENVNRTQVDQVAKQISALGPVPEDGESDPPEVALRRQQLSDQMASLNAPMLRANEAYVQADALVSRVDRTIRDRAARETLSRGPSPLNLLNWGAPLADVEAVVVQLWSEARANLASEEDTNTILGNTPAAIAALLLGMVLVFRPRAWALHFEPTIGRVKSKASRRLLRLLSALLQLALPWGGLVLILQAINLTGVLGITGSATLYSLGVFGLCVITGIWLVRQMFPLDDDGDSPFGFKPSRMAFARWISTILVITLSLGRGFSAMSEQVDLPELSENFLFFPLTVVSSYALFLIARIFKRNYRHVTGSSDEVSFMARVHVVLANLGMAIGLFAPVAGAVGYLALSERLIFASGFSFLLFGLVAVLQRGVDEFYDLVFPPETPNESALLPTLVGAALGLASLPFLVLLWGGRVTDLTEAWTKFKAGLVVGGVTVSPGVIFSFLLVFMAMLIATRVLQSALRNTILPKTKLDLGARTALDSGIGYIGVFLAGLIAFTTAGIDLSSLAILASALAVGIGFGLQTIVSNFVSGIILLIERPVSEGDWIEVSGQMGIVKRISVRATRIETFDRTDVIVPNADLVSGMVTNWTRGNLIGRAIVPVRVAFDSDTRQVERILNEIAEDQPLVVMNPAPQILFRGIGEHALNFEVRVILRDVNFLLNVQSDINHAIAKRFAEEGIVIPFPQRDIWLRGGEGLAQVAARDGQGAKFGPYQPLAQTAAQFDSGGDGGDGDH